MASKVEINARIVVTVYKLLFLFMEKHDLNFYMTNNYVYTKASFCDFNMLCSAISCAPKDYVGIADALAKIINGYKAKVLPELSDTPHDVVVLSHRVLANMERMHRYCLDQLS